MLQITRQVNSLKALSLNPGMDKNSLLKEQRPTQPFMSVPEEPYVWAVLKKRCRLGEKLVEYCVRASSFKNNRGWNADDSI